MNKSAELPQLRSVRSGLDNHRNPKNCQANGRALEGSRLKKKQMGGKEGERGQRRVQPVASSCPDLTSNFLCG